MQEYCRVTGIVQAVQWTGLNKEEVTMFYPKAKWTQLIDEERDEDQYRLALREAGRLVPVPLGDYILKEDEVYFVYPQVLFKKHYQVSELYSDELNQLLLFIQRVVDLGQEYGVNLCIEKEWDDELEICFIHHDNPLLESVAEGDLADAIAILLDEMFYSQQNFDIAFGYSEELALRKKEYETCLHPNVSVYPVGNVGLEPRYEVFCEKCAKSLTYAILREQVLDFVEESGFKSVNGLDQLAFDEEEED